MLLEIRVIKSAPKAAPSGLPIPPKMLTPPITAELITSSTTLSPAIRAEADINLPAVITAARPAVKPAKT